ncbi:MAG: helix-turn-helix domain-containing protein [Clostridia bacterium]|nr:helix-turn-helix domain-containing protein [Clostridia bacterium]
MFYTSKKNEPIIIEPCASEYAAPHKHDFLELVYVTKGAAKHYVAENESIIRKGDYLVIDYGTSHSYKSIDDRGFEVINCLFLPDLIDRSLVHCRSFSELLNHYLIKMSVRNMYVNPSNYQFRDKDGKIYMLLRSMMDEYNQKAPGFTEMIRCQLIELFIITMRTVTRDSEKTDDAIIYITDRVEKNYMNKITLTELSHELCYSTSYLSLKFKTATGMGFTEYLEKKRINEACRLLANTNKKISEIAFSVGYSDVNFFYRIFRKYAGASPLEMRKKYSSLHN